VSLTIFGLSAPPPGNPIQSPRREEATKQGGALFYPAGNRDWKA